MTQFAPEPGSGCFSAHYAEARHRFLSACRQLPQELIQDQHQSTHPMTGPTGEPLYCDLVLLGKQVNPERLLVLISATHGVEGFAGSAIESDCLAVLAASLTRHDRLGVVMIHGLNPWGFAWLRRCDHDGIDLNRNFVDFGQPLPRHPDYDRPDNDLCHPERLTPEALEQVPDLDAFAEAATRGQYSCPHSCFYGGTGPGWSRRVLETIGSHACFRHASRIAVLDLHTGLGPYGHGELINDHPPGSTGDGWAMRWYGGDARSAQRGESVSPPKVGLIDFFWHDLIGDRGCFVTLEFGTYTVDRLLAVLFREQAYHNALSKEGRPRQLDSPAVRELRDFFCPPDPAWQARVLARGQQVVSMALRGLLDDRT